MAKLTPVTLWPAQKPFFEAGPQPTMFLGGVGAGKSYVGVLKMLALLDEYPGSRGAIVRDCFVSLKRTTGATLYKLLPKDHVVRRNDQEGRLILKNGSELLLFHLGNPDSLTNLKSLELNFAYVDQCEDIGADAWDILWERVGRWSGAEKKGGWSKDWKFKDRLGHCIPPRYLFASCYSPGYDHWITQRFWEHGTERARYKKEGYQVFIGSTRDNLALSDEYVQGRLAMGDEYIRRFVDAVDWGANEGRIFDLDPMSILEPTPELLNRIYRTMRLHRVYDHGEFSPAACLWYATDAKENVFYFREYMEGDKLVSYHRNAIYNLSLLDSPQKDTLPSYHTNYADPSIFNKNRGRSVNEAPRWTVADEWTERRIVDAKTAVFWRPANNDEAYTVNRVKEYLRRDNSHRHPITGQLGAPRVYFLRRTDDYPHGCFEVLRDIRSAMRKKMGELPDGTKLYSDERDDKVRDHLLDCVRYSIGMRPSLAIVQTVEDDQPGTIRIDKYLKDMDAWNLERDRTFKNRGYGY